MKTKSQIRKSVDTSAPGVQNRNEQARTISGNDVATATTTASAPAPAGVVHFHGPEPVMDKRQDQEIPVWRVFVGDAEANPISRVYKVHSFTKAAALALAMSKDRNLALTQDAQPA
jgi:hypothetical protein